jgi:TorA maturation chaperone TorD
VECEEEALGRGDVEGARSAVRKQGDFCRALLHPWVPEFCRRIRDDRDAHPLYTWGAGLLERKKLAGAACLKEIFHNKGELIA